MHTTEAAFLAIAVEYADEVHDRITALQCRGKPVEVKNVCFYHLSNGRQLFGALCMSRDDAALVATVAQPARQVSTDKARASDKRDTLNLHDFNNCSGWVCAIETSVDFDLRL
jgi:hypothetical protein